VRDLLVTGYTPVLDSGRGVRSYGIACALAAHRQLDLLYVRFGAEEPALAFKEIEGVTLHEVISSRGARRARAYVAARLAGVPADFARGASPELSARAAELAAAPDRGRVIADGPTAAAALARLARSRPVIYSAHNLESGFRASIDGLGTREQRALQAFERSVLGRSSESWMVSDAELDAARKLCPAARLRYVPNVIDVAPIVPAYERGADLSRTEPGLAETGPDLRALFVASFSYQPNRNGLRFLLEEVFPRAWEEEPAATLTLAGAGLERWAAPDARVQALGFVHDLATEYARARCALVPLLQGGGTPLKLIEALAYGLPVIATPQAVSGLEVRDGEECIVAEGGEQFARALTQMLRDPDPELGRRGRALIAERYSIEALSELLAP
jgi:glycosyltransferase involved in cell wall biosynthesis